MQAPFDVAIAHYLVRLASVREVIGSDFERFASSWSFEDLHCVTITLFFKAYRQFGLECVDLQRNYHESLFSSGFCAGHGGICFSFRPSFDVEATGRVWRHKNLSLATNYIVYEQYRGSSQRNV